MQGARAGFSRKCYLVTVAINIAVDIRQDYRRHASPAGSKEEEANMRTICITFMALITGAVLVSGPLPAHASQSSPFVQFLVDKVCSGQPASYMTHVKTYKPFLE